MPNQRRVGLHLDPNETGVVVDAGAGAVDINAPLGVRINGAPLAAALSGAYARFAGSPTLPAGAVAQTLPREVATITDLGALLSGRLLLVAVNLPAATTITSITFLSRTTAAVTPTNQWFALFDNAATPALLGQTADNTTTAWAANTLKTLALSSPFVTSYSGLHYLGIMVAAATVPTLAGINVSSGAFAAIAPVVAGTSTTGLTTPASFTSPAAAPTGTTTVPYAYVS